MPMNQDELDCLRETHDVVIELRTLVKGEQGIMHRLGVVETKVAPLESFKLQVVAVASFVGTVLGLIVPVIFKHIWPSK